MLVIPSSTDWLTSADFNSGTVLVEGRLAEMLHPEVWNVCVAAYAHRLDPFPWDYSGNAHHGVRQAGVTDHAGGWRMSADTQYIEIAETAALDLTAALSLVCWTRPKISLLSNLSNALVIKDDLGANRQYDLQHNASSDDYRFILNGSLSGVTTIDSDANASPQPARGECLIGTWDGTTMKLFRGGVQQTATAALAEALADGSAPIRLGGFSDDVNPTRTIFAAAIYSEALDRRRIDIWSEDATAPFQCRLLPKVFSFQ